ncbi:hypothetical protein BGX38DRAFT_1202962 [Terfezia claveryi]|nr:hypothetical protein BGX38DRAFT_1202962 [Terfezia claveryi]
MDAIKNAISGSSNSSRPTETNTKPQKTSSGGWGDKLNTALGGGRSSEAKEDYLDKGVDAFQQHVLGQGPQDNESALEQAKDERISDFIRGTYKSTSGKEFPIADK